MTSFSAVAANFAGVPLAFAFVSTLGSLGLLTQVLKGSASTSTARLQPYSMTGLTIVYSYFQIPLMVIIITRRCGAAPEWREAAENLGARPANTGAWSACRCWCRR